MRPARLSIGRWTCLAALAAACLVAQPTPAAIIEIEMVSTIGSLFSSVHMLPMAVGDDVVVRFRYDDSVPDATPMSGEGTFPNAVVEASLEFPDSGPSFLFGGGTNQILTADDLPSGGGLDLLGISASPISGDLLVGDALDALFVVVGQRSTGGAPTLLVDKARIRPSASTTAKSYCPGSPAAASSSATASASGWERA